MNAIPTGRRELRDGRAHVVYERSFAAPTEAVWAAVTEPARLERWIGTWTGDPATGQVAFRMTAEGDDVSAETYTIDACEPPRRLVVRTTDPSGMTWLITLELTGAGGATTLTFAQELSDPEVAASVGPGWDYYLDRLVAAETGGEPASVVWGDYEPQSAHYRELFARAT